ncbi:hypothetical protein D3C79_986990 [compost metagenome]
MNTWPEVGVIRRLIIFRVVLLPQPEGPRNTQISPSLTVRLTESTALTSLPLTLKVLLRFFSSIMSAVLLESGHVAGFAAAGRR